MRVCERDWRVEAESLNERESEGLGTKRLGLEDERKGESEEKKSLKLKRDDEREGKVRRIFVDARRELM